MTDSLPGKGTNPGDVSIVNNGNQTDIVLKGGNGKFVDFGAYGDGASRYVTKAALEGISGQPIFVTANNEDLCKGLTDYKTDYAPIVLEVNPDQNVCQLDD